MNTDKLARGLDLYNKKRETDVLNPATLAWRQGPKGSQPTGYDLSVMADPVNKIHIELERLRRRRIFVDGTDEESRIAISAFKSLRTHMLREMAARSLNSLVITGTTQGVGKSVAAANLAINIARHKEKHVLLVDLDLRSPSIASLFGLKPKFGIDTVAGEESSLERSILHSDIDRLSILPCLRPHQNSTEILLSKQMRTVLEVLQRPNYEQVVIFDAPPILGCDDVAALTSLVDLYLVVIEEGRSSRRELKAAMSVLGDAPIAGVLLNKSKQNFFKRYYY